MTTVLPAIIDDLDLDKLFQDAVTQITGLPGNMVRPRFQEDMPRRPEPVGNWCAIGVMLDQSDDSPVIMPDPDPGQVKFIDHERLEVLASFYGPQGKQYAKLLRDGIKIPQNMEGLQTNNIYFQDASVIRRVPALINQQWQNRYDLPLTFNRKIERLYPIERFKVARVHFFDDHPTDKSVFDATISVEDPNAQP